MEYQKSSRISAAVVLIVSVTIAFLIRVLPAYGAVFGHRMVNFQEPDAWFHVRTVHNLLAHFPWRSGFDPYVLFPAGQNVQTGPVWDYLLAIPAWILGLGSPSTRLIDGVAAWLPAILGALYPIPAFFLARRVFDAVSGAFAALWTATGFGALLWITHLGLADHHAAEGLFAFLTLAWMCAAVDGGGIRYAWWSGIALGLFMGTRPAGIFVPATFACLVMLDTAAAPAVLRAALTGAAIFVTMSATLWSKYAWLALAGMGALAAAIVVLEALGRRQAWPAAVRRLMPFGVVALGSAAAVAAMPHLLRALWFEVHRVMGGEHVSRMVSTVQEMQPIYRAGGKTGWPSIFQALGAAWVLAFPVLARLVLRPVSTAARLLVLWTSVMALGTIAEVRMAIYFLPVSFVLAGAACGWLTERVRPMRRRMAGAALAVLVLGVNLFIAAVQLRADAGVNTDWLAAFTWLRDNSPEPMGDSAAWSRYYPRVKPGDAPPAGRWGVAIWWDRAYAMEQLSHRIPMSNGTQSGADDMARLYAETIPEAAVGWLRRTGARYVVVDPVGLLFGENRSRFPTQIRMLGRHLDSYVQVLAENDGKGGLKSLPVYLPTYYQTLAARLYLADGEAVAGTGPWVFETAPTKGPRGRNVELVLSSRHFNHETEAAEYLSERQSARLTVGCLDAAKSCVAQAAVKGLRRVFSSDPLPLSPLTPVRAVKIFQVVDQ